MLQPCGHSRVRNEGPLAHRLPVNFNIRSSGSSAQAAAGAKETLEETAARPHCNFPRVCSSTPGTTREGLVPFRIFKKLLLLPRSAKGTWSTVARTMQKKRRNYCPSWRGVHKHSVGAAAVERDASQRWNAPSVYINTSRLYPTYAGQVHFTFENGISNCRAQPAGCTRRSGGSIQKSKKIQIEN